MAKTLQMANSLKEQQCIRTMHQISRRFTKLHQHVKNYRRPHFYNDPSVDPKLAEPIAHVRYQSDMPRKIWGQLKARLAENHGQVNVTPRGGQEGSREADDAEATFNAMWAIVEERNATTTQGDLADGQIVDGYSILHWYRMDQDYPETPDYEWLDDLPEDEDGDDEPTKRRKKRTRDRFRPDVDDEGNETGRYKETDKSLQERTKVKRAKAGSPYHWEVPSIYSTFFSRDSLFDVGPIVHVKRVPLIDYDEELRQYGSTLHVENGKAVLKSMREGLESTPGEAPPSDSPSGGDYGTTLSVATLWTKSEWYEFCSEREFVPDAEMTGDGWTLVKSGKHGFGRPPFEVVPAEVFNSNDPLERYLPALEGVFRTKPNHDRLTAIFMGLAERHAIPDQWWETQPSSEPGLTEEGMSVELGTSTANAGHVPQGWTLKQNNVQLNPAFAQARDTMQLDMQESAPSTGQAEIDADTQSWTAKFAINQANAGPRMYLDNQVRALRAMFRSIARDISTDPDDGGFGAAVWVYSRDDEGNETDKIVGIDPQDIETLNVNVSIDPTASSERITNIEHGRTLLEAGLITRRTFYEEHMAIKDASQYMAELDGEVLYNQYIKPGLIAQALAEEFGSQAIFTPDGKLVGFNGQEKSPDQMMAERGYQPAVPPGVPNPMGPGGQPMIPPLVDTAQSGMQPQPMVVA